MSKVNEVEQSNPVVEKVGMKVAVQYAIGNFGLNLIFILMTMYLLYFYTDVFGISASAAAMLFLVTRILDAVTDVGAGFIVDSTKSRWGKFRPYILFGATPMAVTGVLCFTVPNFSDTGMLVYAYVTYIGFGLMYTVVNIPYSSLMAVISQDYQERSTISSVKVVFGTVATLIVASATLPVVQSFSTEKTGFLVISIIFAVIATITLLITFYGTKGLGDTIDKSASKQKEKIPFKLKMKVIGTNLPLLIMLIFIVVNSLGAAVQSGSMLYFFKYIYGDIVLFATYSAVTLGITTLFVVVSPYFVKMMGKRNLAILSQLISVVGWIGLYFFHSSALSIFLFGIIVAIGMGLSRPLLWAMIPDTVEYGEWKTNIRAEGLVYSTFIFTQKLGMALGGALSGIILGATGYVANSSQTPEALQGILISVTIVPIIASIIGIIVIYFYRLDKDKYISILEEIKARKA
ncbi:glycoside-pentoside-hexuronide (GPH):cation symporter [Litchfieldia alkalitelluris]|uniref:glycoside-pentoside-hexuronide (GPH):cation symporter n=1 Tax=Litchfieldia alkalitelluris TaxID=304268 RepID=UPI000996859E|nr:glycoside-pentoside-hexuronide (GPH):cation symporter [Litchfieldia alkalitelluris]